MITQYFRPTTLDEAIQLLAKPNTRPLGGGTVLNQRSDESFAVVDLQALGLDKIHKSGGKLEIGATATLSLLLENAYIPAALAAAIRLEAPLNLRNIGTVAGALAACDGRSPFAAVMLALDAKVIFVPDNEQITLGNYLPLRVGAGLVPARGGRPQGSPLQSQLITKIEIPLNVKLAYESVARTPADKPIVCAALAQWDSGRTRLVLGGWGASPSVAMDGNEASGVEAAARNAAHDAADEWASAEYRSEVAAVLAKRCLEHLQ
ncbi:MAG: putative selenate reductase FAD-binding subunit [Anaerolineaceae bacterium]|nr:MAG: putative selenate reductase FAD-binding subunit [Anaerolineaceae bacterium]